MGKVTGIGGVFFKAEDPAALRAWYEEHLGLGASPPFSTATGMPGAVDLHWLEPTDPPEKARTVWAAFPAATGYFDPSEKPFMLNYRVDDLDAVLGRLRRAGVPVDETVEEYDYGRFGWAMDPEGNRIELWEPRQAHEALTTETETADRSAIEALHRSDVAASLAGDVDALRQLVTEDAVTMPPGQDFQRAGTLLDGMEPILAGLEVLEYEQDFEEVLVFDEHAVEWGTITGAMRPAGSEEEPRRYAYKVMRILRRGEDGAWRIHRTIWNEMPVPAGE